VTYMQSEPDHAFCFGIARRGDADTYCGGCVVVRHRTTVEDANRPSETRNQGSDMRVDVDRQKCTGLGMCEAEAPHLFEVAPDGSLVVLKSEVDGTDLEAAEAAIAACPTEALRLSLGK
jgi:ferredoxin